MSNVPKKVIIHHDGVNRNGSSFDVINAYHKQQNFPLSVLGFYVGYHYVIERDGSLRQAREEHEIGAHTIGQNDKSIGICLAGGFDTELPSPEQKATLGQLLVQITGRYSISATEIYPHRAFARKTCYGSLLHDLWGRAVLVHELCKGWGGLAPDLAQKAKELVLACERVPLKQ